MNYSYIKFETNGGWAEITLNRPDKLNSFNRPMAEELQDAIKKAATDDNIRCVILTGAGRGFCAGQDLKEVLDRHGEPLGNTVKHSYNPIILAIRELEKPVICAVNGTAAGAGANIALACDFVLAAENAVFVQSFSKIGLIPDSGGTFFLPRLVGLPRATAMAMLGEKITAGQAVDIGLIYKSYADEELMVKARELAGYLAEQPTRGFGLIKRGFNESLGNDLQSQLELEAELQTEAGKTHDYNEGVQAFVEKRKPKFTGK
ncbi:MAG TPA: enoyl-CoA hydratase [Balneolales bacterium]|nr:enoyl-CoA hydratase [Balneolales bacterium]